jgi:hypothetical protein
VVFGQDAGSVPMPLSTMLVPVHEFVTGGVNMKPATARLGAQMFSAAMTLASKRSNAQGPQRAKPLSRSRGDDLRRTPYSQGEYPVKLT